MSDCKKILLGVTGSIAAYKAADIIRRLQEKNYSVSVVMTKEAELFISALTLGSLCGGKIHQNMFEREESWRMNHIRLGKEADVILIAPATANMISKIACGLADDLLSCSILATQAKILIAPAMNNEMLKNKIIQENIKKLKDLGMVFVEPVYGKLACGIEGEGHLAEVDEIVSAVVRLTSI